MLLTDQGIDSADDTSTSWLEKIKKKQLFNQPTCNLKQLNFNHLNDLFMDEN